MTPVRLGWLVTLLSLLSACGNFDQGDLREWMAQERAQARPRVTPITEPKEFFPQQYVIQGSLEPFDSQRLTLALRRESAQSGSNAALIAPELVRRKEPLEAFPLDAMSMVGSLSKAGKPTALLNVDKLLYQVKVGDYLGLNYGRITKINETVIQLREIVQDATGDWTERAASLELQEGAKK